MKHLLSIEFPENAPLESLKELEWIETNGLGGWASSTLSGAHTRRYHGILVSSLHPPVKRVVMLSRLDETVILNGHPYCLATRIYSDAVNPEGYRYLRKFEKNAFATFYYTIPTDQGPITLTKSIAMPSGYNATIIRYEIIEAPGQVTLELAPFIAARDYHSLTHANDAIDTRLLESEALVSFKPYSGLPPIKIVAPGGIFRQDPKYWYYRFDYEKERERGLDCEEDLYQYGAIIKTMNCGETFDVVITTEEAPLPEAACLIEEERIRRLALLEKLPKRSLIIDTLALAADQFLVKRGNDLKTIIAGYHWFTDWGRDTMISLPGLCLSMGRFKEAKQILLAFTDAMSQGMIPNRFRDEGEVPEYNTVDATLWYFIALYEYYRHTGDEDFVKALYPKLIDSIGWHDKGTRYRIKTDVDGLLSQGEPSVQLTWMDAKVGDLVITPRIGKPVEINALWCNALAITAQFATLAGDHPSATLFQNRAEEAMRTFCATFWNESARCLYDVVQGSEKDPSIRPNQIIALSLPFELIDSQKASQILGVVKEKLLTPFGLRSLDPAHPSYAPRYTGNPYQRDSAYHQGTVWSWLLGPYLTALRRYRGSEGEKEVESIIEGFASHLYQAGIGTVSEIFDGEWPHTPRGCIAQAWSTAEILRCLLKG